jgi:hypothetical protein
MISRVVRRFSVGWCSWLIVVHGHESGVRRMRAFPVRLPSGVRYWTVLDEDLAVVDEATRSCGMCGSAATARS